MLIGERVLRYFRFKSATISYLNVHAKSDTLFSFELKSLLSFDPVNPVLYLCNWFTIKCRPNWPWWCVPSVQIWPGQFDQFYRVGCGAVVCCWRCSNSSSWSRKWYYKGFNWRFSRKGVIFSYFLEDRLVEQVLSYILSLNFWSKICSNNEI